MNFLKPHQHPRCFKQHLFLLHDVLSTSMTISVQTNKHSHSYRNRVSAVQPIIVVHVADYKKIKRVRTSSSGRGLFSGRQPEYLAARRLRFRATRIEPSLAREGAKQQACPGSSGWKEIKRRTESSQDQWRQTSQMTTGKSAWMQGWSNLMSPYGDILKEQFNDWTTLIECLLRNVLHSD